MNQAAIAGLAMGYPPRVVASLPRVSIPAGPFTFTERLPSPPGTTHEALDAAVEDLRAAAPRWVATGVGERIRLLDKTMQAVASVADAWIDRSIRAEAMDPADPVSAEEAIVGPYFLLRGLRVYRDTLRDLQRHGRPRLPGAPRAGPDGRAIAPVFPNRLLDRLLFLGVRAEVWMEPGVTVAALPESMAGTYRRPHAGGVCLVLGGGNVSSIGPLDVLQKLLVEDRVVILKTHPVNAHLAELLDAAFEPFIRAGFLRIVHGDAVQGGYLCHHPGVDELHITGSDRTYEAIVYGAGPDGHERKLRDEPILHKPFTAELGNITPIIVVPGPWSRRDLDVQADNIATMLTNNAGFNCTTARAIVTHREWPLREALLARIRSRLAATPLRTAFYPGAAERMAAFLATHPEAERIGEDAAAGAGGGSTGDRLPWVLIPGLDPAASDDPCYRVEAFCSVTAETPIAAPDAATFLDRAVEFANGTLWGTLNATIIVHPATSRDPATGPALERAIADLRYGTVSLNHWSAIGFGLATTPWGAFPGHPRHDIGSGTGWVHNGLLFDRPEKTVVHAPFRPWPKPVWFASHRTANRLARRLVRLEAGDLRQLPAILALALRG